MPTFGLCPVLASVIYILNRIWKFVKITYMIHHRISCAMSRIYVGIYTGCGTYFSTRTGRIKDTKYAKSEMFWRGQILPPNPLTQFLLICQKIHWYTLYA